MSYQLDLIGVDGKAATETHELAQATEVGVFVRDGRKETWIPWSEIHVASITDLDAGEVRQPEVRVVQPRLPDRRRAR
jgi:hypothetical protein